MNPYDNFTEYDVYAKACLVSPKMAKMALGNMCINRKLRPSLIKKYAHSMLQGQWKINGEAIVFSKSGVLLEGQHRMNAVVVADISVPMLIVKGVEDSKEVLATINDGASRTLTDRLTMQGITLNNIHAATLRSLLFGLSQAQGNGRNPSSRFTTLDYIELFEKHYDAIEFAVSATRNKRGIASASVCGAISRAYYHVDKGELLRFCNALVDNYAQSPEERSATLLHSFLLTHTNGGGGMIKKERYAKTERAIQAFISGKSIAKLFSTKEELFPLPF